MKILEAKAKVHYPSGERAEGVWDSGLKYVEPKIIVPEFLTSVLKAIDRALGGSTEFSVLAKGRWDEDGFRLSKEYAIPKQTVSYAHVDYNDRDTTLLISKGFNVVIHKHPSGMRSFSKTDIEFINKNFEASLLWVDNGFFDATLRIEVKKDIFLCICPKVEVVNGLPKVDVSNIDVVNFDTSRDSAISEYPLGYYSTVSAVREEMYTRKPFAYEEDEHDSVRS